MAYATAAALTLGTVLSSGMPVLANAPDERGQSQGTESDYNGGGESVQQDQGRQQDGGSGLQEENSPAGSEGAEASVAEAENIQDEFFAEAKEGLAEEETVQSYGEIGWYPLAAFGWSSLADAQKDPAFNISNYNAQYNAYYGVPTVPGFSMIDVGAGAGINDPVRPEEPGKDDGLRDWNRRPPKPPCCSSDDDDDDDDDDDTTAVTTAANIGNGTTFSVADPALLPAEFANGAFYSVTAAGVVYFNNIDLSGQYFQTWDNSGNMIATLVLVDENLEIVEIDRAELVNIGAETYLSFEAEGAAYAAVSSDTQLIYKTICGFDGVVVNGIVVMEF